MSIATDPAAAVTGSPASRPSSSVRILGARAARRAHRLQRGAELTYRSTRPHLAPRVARLLTTARERLAFDGCSEAACLRPGAIRRPRHSAARLLPGAAGAILSLGK